MDFARLLEGREGGGEEDGLDVCAVDYAEGCSIIPSHLSVSLLSSNHLLSPYKFDSTKSDEGEQSHTKDQARSPNLLIMLSLAYTNPLEQVYLLHHLSTNTQASKDSR